MSRKKDRCVPDGLDHLLEIAGDDVWMLHLMIKMTERIIAARKPNQE